MCNLCRRKSQCRRRKIKTSPIFHLKRAGKSSDTHTFVFTCGTFPAGGFRSLPGFVVLQFCLQMMCSINLHTKKHKRFGEQSSQPKNKIKKVPNLSNSRRKPGTHQSTFSANSKTPSLSPFPARHHHRSSTRSPCFPNYGLCLFPGRPSSNRDGRLCNQKSDSRGSQKCKRL